MQNRPGLITLIGWLLIIGAAFGAVAGIVTIALRNAASVIDATGAASSQLVIAGSVTLVIAAIQGLIGVGLLGGRRIARGIIAGLQVIHVAAAAYVMFTHHTGAFLYQGLITVALSLFILWALFNEKADEYFNAA